MTTGPCTGAFGPSFALFSDNEADHGYFRQDKERPDQDAGPGQTQLEWMVKGKSLDESAFDGIEEAVVLADAGLEAADALVGALRQRWKTGRIKTEEDLKPAMAEEIEKLLLPVEKPIDTGSAAPFVVLAIGVNGAGKTTTIAKLARIYLDDGKKVMFGACDTFRAAAIEQTRGMGAKARHRDDKAPVRQRPGCRCL